MKLSSSLSILLHDELLSLSDAKHANFELGLFKNKPEHIENRFCGNKTVRQKKNILHFIFQVTSIKIKGVF